MDNTIDSAATCPVCARPVCNGIFNGIGQWQLDSFPGLGREAIEKFCKIYPVGLIAKRHRDSLFFQLFCLFRLRPARILNRDAALGINHSLPRYSGILRQSPQSKTHNLRRSRRWDQRCDLTIGRHLALRDFLHPFIDFLVEIHYSTDWILPKTHILYTIVYNMCVWDFMLYRSWRVLARIMLF